MCSILERWPDHFYLESSGSGGLNADPTVRYLRPMAKGRARTKLRHVIMFSMCLNHE